MLKGTYNYKGYLYSVEAYDFDDNIAVYLTPHTTKSRQFLDKGIKGEGIDGSFSIPAQWDKLYVSVGTGNVSASCFVYEDTDMKGNPVKYKNNLNAEVLIKFGSILRGMKSACNNSNKETDDLYVIFSPTRILTYKFPQGYMNLEIRTIKSMSYECNEVSLVLDEDYSYNLKIEKITSINHKFALDLSEFVTEVSEDWDFDNDDTVFSLQDIIEANPHKSYVWLKERKYHIVKGIDEVERICKLIWSHEGIVAFDTETTGLNVNITSRQGIGDRLVGMVFSIKPGEAWYFPIRHKKVENICDPSNENYIITKYFKPILEEKDILCHNGSFDWKVMYNYDIFLNLVHDTLILFKVTMWNDHRDMPLKLKLLTHNVLNRDSFELDDFVKGKFGSNNIKFWDLEEESVKYYACPDTDNLIELYQYCVDTNLLAKYGAKKIYQIEVAFSICIAYQEYYGHCVDITKIDDLVKGILTTKETEYKAMVDLVGHDFNPRSNKDLPKIMYEELKYPILGHTDTGNPSCGKKVRKKLMDEVDAEGKPKYPFVQHLHNYLESCTLESNFTKNIDKFATEDGLMFSQVEQFLETGRVSVKEPNYQSYSDVVKHYIIPRSGYFALDADYSSVEARIMVSMAGCKDMVERMKDPDTDYHTIKASQMFNIPYEMVTHKQRKMSKGVNFGILYGLGDPNLGVNLYGSKTPENTRKAKRQKEKYFVGMEELKDFIEKSKAQGVTQFYSVTDFGRRRYFDSRRVRKDTIERQSCNARIQGTAADIYKVAMVRLLHQLRKRNWLGKVLISAFVHDECFLEVHKSLDPIVVLGVLRRCMMLDKEGWCPLYIGAGFGRNWYEAKNTEIPIQVQESLIESYGEVGLSWWNGDTDKLCTFIVDEINNYGRDRVINYLSNCEKGKVLPPAINSLAHDVVDAIIDGAVIEGCVCTDIERKTDTLENLGEFCKAFDCSELLEKAEVAKPTETVTNNDEEPDEETDPEEVTWEDTMRMYINSIGCYYRKKKVNDEEDIPEAIYFRYDENNPSFLTILHNFFKKHEGTVEVFAVKGNELFTTGMFVDKSVYPDLVKKFAIMRSLSK